MAYIWVDTALSSLDHNSAKSLSLPVSTSDTSGQTTQFSTSSQVADVSTSSKPDQPVTTLQPTSTSQKSPQSTGLPSLSAQHTTSLQSYPTTERPTASSKTSSVPMNSVTTASSHSNILPITVLIFGSSTGTFSQAQDTNRAHFTGITTVQTTLTASRGGEIQSTVVPVVIGPGGFFWEPKPLPPPDPPKFPPIPPIPTPPEPPKNSCFTLGDIFSLKCPPASGGGGNSGGKDDGGDDRNNQTPASNKSGSQTPTKTTAVDSTSAMTRTTITNTETMSSHSSSTKETSSTSQTSTCTPNIPNATNGLAARASDDSCLPLLPCVVWPKNAQNKTETDAIAAQLRSLVSDPDSIFTSDTKTMGMNYWRVPLTLDQVTTLEKNIYIGAITLQTDHADPTTAIIRQEDATDDMCVVSQQPGLLLSWTNSFFYDDSAGEGIDVYVVDSGLHKAHSEFTMGENIASKVRYIHVHPDFDGRTPEDDSSLLPDRWSGKSHGTCMLSRIGGHLFGVAKKINPIVVRVPRRHPGGFPEYEDYLDGVARVNDDIGDMKKKAVLNMSWLVYRHNEHGGLTFPSPKDPKVDNSDMFRTRLRDLLKVLIRKGVLPVTGSGNLSRRQIDGWPASFGKSNAGEDYIPELLVAGAVYVDGSMWPNSGTDPEGIPHIWAPGVDIKCATGMVEFNRENIYKATSGTSLASATTAGLAAYFLGLFRDSKYGVDVSTPQKLKDYILSLAHPRKNNLKVVWNGAYPLEYGLCPVRPRAVGTQSSGPINCEFPVQTTKLGTTLSTAVQPTTNLSVKASASTNLRSTTVGLTTPSVSTTRNSLTSSLPPRGTSTETSMSNGSSEQRSVTRESVTTQKTTLETHTSTAQPSSQPPSEHPLRESTSCRIIIRQSQRLTRYSQQSGGRIPPITENVVHIKVSNDRGTNVYYDHEFAGVTADKPLDISVLPQASDIIPYRITVDFTAEDRRPAAFRDWLVRIHAGPTNWDFNDTDQSKLPFCRVGNWP
ncbi:hypothetical protein PRK78_007101 [Emydomyces testavorans]|uniref:Peptidase S8/S53 domain-containing protein n=1 Tax=Emydomyces testavorans TaxID=2070801 RepID=A0AAF0DRF7_9EURO|nr:hypothetical protein PRK78_007101 [Emydomyces testavorans]